MIGEREKGSLHKRLDGCFLLHTEYVYTAPSRHFNLYGQIVALAISVCVYVCTDHEVTAFPGLYVM